MEVEEEDGEREEGDGGERGKKRRKERYGQEDTGNWYFYLKNEFSEITAERRCNIDRKPGRT